MMRARALQRWDQKLMLAAWQAQRGEGRRRRKREVAALGEKWSAGNIIPLKENTNERESGVDDYRELADSVRTHSTFREIVLSNICVLLNKEKICHFNNKFKSSSMYQISTFLASWALPIAEHCDLLTLRQNAKICWPVPSNALPLAKDRRRIERYQTLFWKHFTITRGLPKLWWRIRREKKTPDITMSNEAVTHKEERDAMMWIINKIRYEREILNLGQHSWTLVPFL